MLHFFCNSLLYICILIFLSYYFFHLFVITICMHTYINGLLCNRRTVYQSKMEKMKQKQRMSRCVWTGDFSLLTVAINCSVICTISLIAWRNYGSCQNSYSTDGIAEVCALLWGGRLLPGVRTDWIWFIIEHLGIN